MTYPEFEAQWKAIAAWDWGRIEGVVAREGVARLYPAPGQRRGSRHPAEAAPEDVPPGVPAELAPEDLRSEVKLDVEDNLPSPLSPETVERQLYHAAALHAHCEQRGLAMGAVQDPDGSVWVCAKRRPE